MAETAAPRPDGQPGTGSGEAGEESLGGLVSLAIRDLSQLVRWEIDLAKLELRDDLKRVAISAVMMGGAGFLGCLVLVMLSFAAAYGIEAAGMPGGLGAAFGIVAAGWLLLAGAAVFIGVRKIRRLEGMRRTRASVRDSLTLIRSNEQHEGDG